MIDFELEQRLHQRKEHFYRDYILQNESDSLTAFVVICPKDIMTSRLTALKLLDLRPTQVTTTYSMMARLLFKKMPLGTGAVIHIEAHCANLLVIAQQQIIYVETVARLEDCLNTTIALLLTALQQHNVQIEEILLTGCEQLAAQELQQLTNDHSYRLSAADQDWTVASQLIEPATS